MHTLGVRPRRFHSDARAASLGDAATLPDCLEWTIDGRLLRELHPYAGEVTMLVAGSEAEWPLRSESLRRLRGDELPLPRFTPAIHRTRLDRLLGRRGRPVAATSAAFEDGRVVLLWCSCGDLDCGALSVEVGLGVDTVTWRDIGWQTAEEPFEPVEKPRAPGRGDLVFDRVQYLSIIERLLDSDWSKGLPAWAEAA